MLFRAEYRAGFKNPVKNPYHHLLIKLRALFQNRRLMKIGQFENIRSPFSASGAQLGGMDLCKSLAVQKIPKAPDNSFLDPETGQLTDIS